MQSGVLVLGEVGEVEQVRLSEVKGRRYGEGLVDELAVRGHEMQLRDDIEERTQGQ
jgi:hypothetical protein